MLLTALMAVRACFRVLWIAGMAALIALVALPHILGVLDRQMLIVRGASMSPDIAVGAIVVVHEVDARTIKPGDVITFRAGSGTIVTHRVTTVSGGSQVAFATKGDASEAPDPVVVPAEAVLGVVELDVPTIGLILTVLSTTAGMVVVLALLGSLLLGGWFIDELVATTKGPVRLRSRAGESSI